MDRVKELEENLKKACETEDVEAVKCILEKLGDEKYKFYDSIKIIFEKGNPVLLKLIMPHLENIPITGQWALKTTFELGHKDMIEFILSPWFINMMKFYKNFFEWNYAFFGAIIGEHKELVDIAIKEHGEWKEKHGTYYPSFNRINWSEGIRIASTDMAKYIIEKAEEVGEKIRECEQCRYEETNKHKQIGFWKHELRYWEETCSYELPKENSNVRDEKLVKSWCTKLSELEDKLDILSTKNLELERENLETFNGQLVSSDGSMTDDYKKFISSVIADSECLQKMEGKMETFGISMCRICKTGNGGTEYYSGGFVWPDGYSHYVKDHKIHVPDDFWDYVDSNPRIF